MDAVVAALARGRNRRRRLTRAIAVASGVVVATVAIAVPLVVRGGAPVRQDRRLDLQSWVDQRPGCNCPFSTCVDGRCLSVCDASNFVLGTPVPDISQPGRQEILAGASHDGGTILYLAGDGCAADHLYLARRDGTRFVSTDLTEQLARVGLAVFEGCCTLARDGGSLIVRSAARTGFVRARLAGTTVLPPDVTELAHLIPEPIDLRTVSFPALSVDERTLFHRIDGPRDEYGDAGPYDGVFAAVRADPGVPFTPGRRMPGFARRYESVSGISSDGLTVFMASEFQTQVMFRGAVSEEQFTSFHVTVPPARLPGWRTIPIEGCKRLLTTGTPGGCHQEDIIYLDPVYLAPYFDPARR
jgi:hypothetical protein